MRASESQCTHGAYAGQDGVCCVLFDIGVQRVIELVQQPPHHRRGAGCMVSRTRRSTGSECCAPSSVRSSARLPFHWRPYPPEQLLSLGLFSISRRLPPERRSRSVGQRVRHLAPADRTGSLFVHARNLRQGAVCPITYPFGSKAAYQRRCCSSADAVPYGDGPPPVGNGDADRRAPLIHAFPLR